MQTTNKPGLDVITVDFIKENSSEGFTAKVGELDEPVQIFQWEATRDMIVFCGAAMRGLGTCTRKFYTQTLYRITAFQMPPKTLTSIFDVLLEARLIELSDDLEDIVWVGS